MHSRGPSIPKGLASQGIPQIYHRKEPWCTFQSSVNGIAQLKSGCLPIADVDKLVSKVSLNHVISSFHSGWGGGILRLFCSFLALRAPSLTLGKETCTSGDSCGVAQQTKGTRQFLLPPSHLGIRTSHRGRVAGLWNNGRL